VALTDVERLDGKLMVGPLSNRRKTLGGKVFKSEGVISNRVLTQGFMRHLPYFFFIDDYSKTTWVYLLKDKSDVLSIFQMFHKFVRTQFNVSIKIFI
jgi:hypothetical protein